MDSLKLCTRGLYKIQVCFKTSRYHLIVSAGCLSSPIPGLRSSAITPPLLPSTK